MKGTRRNFSIKVGLAALPATYLITLPCYFVLFDVKAGYAANPHDHTGQWKEPGWIMHVRSVESIKLPKDRCSCQCEFAVSRTSGEVRSSKTSLPTREFAIKSEEEYRIYLVYSRLRLQSPAPGTKPNKTRKYSCECSSVVGCLPIRSKNLGSSP